jgi:uncharacterized protein (DUF302 family)
MGEKIGDPVMNATMTEQIAYRLESEKPFDEVAKKLESLPPEHQFRVLAVHDVQATLKDKGLERGPLKIIEVCNAGFAHKALQQDVNVALFMPCRFTVYTEGSKTIVTLARPSSIAAMLPESGLEELAGKVEDTLKKIMHEAV